jgi:hypothetical protein
MKTTTDYQQNAKDFLKRLNIEFKCEFVKHDFHFPGDKEKRDIYKITLTRGGRIAAFEFGNSIANSGFYYTKGRRIIEIDRKHLDKTPGQLVAMIRNQDFDFNNNGKSDKIHIPTQPTEYNLLACLQKYDVGTFEDFCNEFGYDTDSRTAEKTYDDVKEEYLKVCSIFSPDEMNELQEIQ